VAGAYRVLVCGVSQLIPTFGQIALRGARPPRCAQIALCNLTRSSWARRPA
jgi:hypothetical protein